MKLKAAQLILIDVWEQEVICNRYHAGNRSLRFAGDSKCHFQCQGCAHFFTLEQVSAAPRGHYTGSGGCIRIEPTKP